MLFSHLSSSKFSTFSLPFEQTNVYKFHAEYDPVVIKFRKITADYYFLFCCKNYNFTVYIFYREL